MSSAAEATQRENALSGFGNVSSHSCCPPGTPLLGPSAAALFDTQPLGNSSLAPEARTQAL